eukprot:607746-Pelagomonas_calceolata.AAC.2
MVISRAGQLPPNKKPFPLRGLGKLGENPAQGVPKGVSVMYLEVNKNLEMKNRPEVEFTTAHKTQRPWAYQYYHKSRTSGYPGGAPT